MDMTTERDPQHDGNGAASPERQCPVTPQRAIVMAVVLFAGIAAGVLLSSSHGGRFASYEAQAASYLADEPESLPGEQNNQVATAPAKATVAVYADDSGPVCQEYSKLVSIGGQDETIYGTACRQPDGTWELQ